MEVEQKQIAQFTLRDVKNMTNYKYDSKNYRDLFSTSIVDTHLFNSHNLLEIFFAAKKNTLNNNMLLVESNYIGRDLRNNWYKEDLIDSLNCMLMYTNYSELTKVFQDESEIINFLDFIIDNRVFEKLVKKALNSNYYKKSKKDLVDFIY
ncbi:hypothetical protein [Mammaliicoccus sciuri]|uniref:hypothetical protein n=1 Tax=Mammaliicoccus sciuri TaxID=1296 RepID=UPI0034DDA8DB